MIWRKSKPLAYHLRQVAEVEQQVGVELPKEF
jgi:hypothetical protein